MTVVTLTPSNNLDQGALPCIDSADAAAGFGLPSSSYQLQEQEIVPVPFVPVQTVP